LMIEDFCKFALRKKQIHLLKVVPFLMHAGFISLKTFDGICRSFSTLVENKEAKFSDDEVELIKVHCLEAVQQKWADKAKIKKENAVP